MTPKRFSLAILSDIHYAGAKEKARGKDYELAGIHNPLVRALVRLYRHFVWQRNPLEQGRLLDSFLRQAGSPDFVIANGDYSCNSACIGLADDAAFESASECLTRLRTTFGAARFRAVLGDHELGKFSFVGKRGGMRLQSWKRATEDLQIEPLWSMRLGKYVLAGVVSSLLALPILASEAIPEELPAWQSLRAAHLAGVEQIFESLAPEDKVILFCHDPTALPFLLESQAILARLHQVERTVIGHLHSELVLRQSRILAGLPQITWMGHTAKRLSTALGRARQWRRFHLLLCPALAGIELLKDGGYYQVYLDPVGTGAAEFTFQRVIKMPK